MKWGVFWMEKLAPRHNFKQWLKDNRMSIIVLAAALVLFIVLRVIAAPEDAAPTTDVTMPSMKMPL